MLYLLPIFLTIIVLYIIRFYYDLIHAFWLSIKLNGPPALPIIGNGLLFFNKTSAENFRIGTALFRQYGEIFRLWLGPQLSIITQDPNDVEILLTSTRHIDKSSEYDFIKPWLNDGLLLSSGKKWHDRRKIITPAFHFNILEKFVEVFDRLGNTVVDKLNKLDTNEALEFYPLAVLYALDVMCETAMGVSIDALREPNSEYVNAVHKITYVLHTRMMDFTLRNPVLYKFSNLAKEQSYALRVLHGFTDDVIQKRRQELMAHKNSNNTDGEDTLYDDVGVRKKRALLDILLNSTIDGKPLADLDIREEVDTFMFEGHDTTTSGITFCLYNIAKYPEVQKKCYKEIIEVLGTDPTLPTTLSLLNQLSYLELAIKESLRLFPSVPLIGRLAMEDILLTNGRIIPKGANVFVPIYTISRCPKFFDDPDEFIPERFLDERSRETKNPFTYIPFSAGPRNCIGQKFAMYEIKSIISKILRNFEVILTKDSEVSPTLSAELILRPENSIEFYFKRRVGQQ